MSKVLLINVSGADKPGLTAALTNVLASFNVDVLDIGQAVIHDFLSLGFLVFIPPEKESAPVVEKFLFQAHELGLSVKFTPVSTEDYERWVSHQGREKHIVTLLARKLTAKQLSVITAALAENSLNIDVITRLSGRLSLEHEQDKPRACVEFNVGGVPKDIHSLRKRFLEISQDTGIDIAFQKDDLYRRNRRLIAFDMDSTLIQIEVIDELAKYAGVFDRVKTITERAMRGEIDFTESLQQRVKLLAGLDVSFLDKLSGSLPLTEGAERLTGILKALGFKLAIISGGFSYFGRVLQQKLGFDYLYANELEIAEGKLTGKCIGPIIDGKKKGELLKETAKKENIRLEQTIAVGDGANDLPMLEAAGLGVAFHAKPIVKETARHSISTLGLDAVLYLIGIRDREVV